MKRITLKAARVNKKMRLVDAAEKLGVAKRTVSSWENGKTMPTVEKIEAICELYDLTYDEIAWNS